MRTFLLVEIFGFGLQILDLSSHGFDLLHILVDHFIVFPDDSILYLKSIQKVLFDNLELQIWLALKDLKHKEWAQDLFFGLVLISLAAYDG
mgnify:CR=1 FL=1